MLRYVAGRGDRVLSECCTGVCARGVRMLRADVYGKWVVMVAKAGWLDGEWDGKVKKSGGSNAGK